MLYWIEEAGTERFGKSTIARRYQTVRTVVEDSIASCKGHHVILELMFSRADKWEEINPPKSRKNCAGFVSNTERSIKKMRKVCEDKVSKEKV